MKSMAHPTHMQQEHLLNEAPKGNGQIYTLDKCGSYNRQRYFN